MSNSPITLAPVEARALPAPGYMGLPEAKHIYLVARDHSFGWPCFGRGYSPADPGELVVEAAVYQEWARELAKPDCGDQYLAGVANTVNGTCHTIANRILALSDRDNANVSNSVDDPYSVMVFGKYGFGTRQFCELLGQSLERTGLQGPDGVLEQVRARVMNPFKDELQAWATVIQNQLKIDVNRLLATSPELASRALAVMTAYCQDRDAMYERNFDYRQGRAPNGEEIGRIRAGLKDLALSYVHHVLEALTVSHLITLQQRDAFEAGIKAYVEQMGL